MDASGAVPVSFEWFAALTGANLKHIYARRRGALVDTARNLAGFLLYEVIGPTKPEGWLTATANGAKRNHSTVRACALKYDWRVGSITTRKGEGKRAVTVTSPMCSPEIAADMERLFDWLEVHWAEPLALHRELIAKARARFRGVLRYWRKKRGSKRLKPEDIARAVAAMGRAMPKVEPRTSVPIIDEPEPVRMLRQAPEIKKLQPEISFNDAYGGGLYIQIVHAVEKEARELLGYAARGLSFFKAQQRTFDRDKDGGGWKGVLHCALASVVLAVAPVFSPWHDGRTEVAERV